MAMQVRDEWEAAFQRLHLALRGDLNTVDILDRSRARIRDAFAHTALQPHRRPLIEFPPAASEVDDDRPNYFTLILDDHGVVSTHRISACDDDQAVDRAWVKADARAFEVWDNGRFVERFDLAADDHANQPEPVVSNGTAKDDAGGSS